MKKVILLCGFALCLVTLTFAFGSPSITTVSNSKLEPKIITSADGLKNTVVVDCGNNGTIDYSCTCGANCNACLAGANAFIAAGGCN